MREREHAPEASDDVEAPGSDSYHEPHESWPHEEWFAMEAEKRLVEDHKFYFDPGKWPYQRNSPNIHLFLPADVSGAPYGVKFRWRVDEGKGRAILEGVFVVRTDGKDLRTSDLRDLGWRYLIDWDRDWLTRFVELQIEVDEEAGRPSNPELHDLQHATSAEAMKDGRRKYPEEHYQYVGKVYREEMAKGTRDILQATTRNLNAARDAGRMPWIPKSTKPFKKTTVRNWIAVARKKGFIDHGEGS